MMTPTSRSFLPSGLLARLGAALVLFLLGMVAVTAIRDLQAQPLVLKAQRQKEHLDFELGLATLKQAAALQPGDARIQLALAEAYSTLWIFRGGDLIRHQADAAFLKSASLSAHWAVPVYRHAQMYAFKDQNLKALALLQEALNRDPNNVAYWRERARFLVSLHRPSEAKIAFARCEELLPNPECALGAQGKP